MAYDYEKLRVTLRQQAIAACSAFAEAVEAGAVEAENRSLDPAGLSLWAREVFLPTAEAKVACAVEQILGRMIFEIVVPKGTGTERLASALLALKAGFEPGLRLFVGGGGLSDYVHVDRADRLPGREWLGVWYAQGVSIAWRSYAALTVT